MQKLITSYLFQRKTCPLPGLGTFSIQKTGAEADFTNRIITSPRSQIEFVNAESNAEGLIAYVAATTGSGTEAAAEALNQYCEELKQKIYAEPTVTLDDLGTLFVDAKGWINFTPEELPSSFMQAVEAERVVHPKSEHHILVGDKETTNTIMAEMLSPKTTIKDRWWIWAFILGAIGIVLILTYFSGSGITSLFGNAAKI